MPTLAHTVGDPEAAAGWSVFGWDIGLLYSESVGVSYIQNEAGGASDTPVATPRGPYRGNTKTRSFVLRVWAFLDKSYRGIKNQKPR
jgi:hypothetical protein